MRPLTVVLATSNEGKVAELRALLGDLPVELLSAAQVLGKPLSVAEDALTFEENAVAKARAVCQATGMLALADDSGLEVEALGGRPGVRSARFAHERATDAENNAALLSALEDVVERAARFRCVLALVSPWDRDRVRVAEGRCDGQIARAPRGSGGFGYDPLFVVDGSDGRAMAELTESEKNAVSHRARAAAALRPLLAELLDEQLDLAERICG
ncbi:MAG TPA: RdgB/HAM1 family non-canonical purine NTP pyrophosphatase [Polyangiaceae bacterium]|nr:RdgB/HAM1 family non-canonical purine NTP pyrophosphatase [Polyangiaceae bacterium]